MFLKTSNWITSKITRSRLEKFLEPHKTKERILDLGSSTGPYKRLFPNAVTVDIDPDTKPDFVADAQDLHIFKDGEFSSVLSTEMLEHLKNPFIGVEEIARVLKPGGKLILTTRFIFPMHNVPHDYFRFTKYGLRLLLEPYFTDILIQEETETLETISVLLQRIGFQTKTLGTTFLKVVWHILAKLLLPFKFLITSEYGDIDMKQKEHIIMTSGYYVTAVRK